MAGQIGSASPNGILITDRSGAIVWVNDALRNTFGYEAREMIGKPVEILVPDDAREGHVAMRDAFVRQPSKRQMGRSVVLFGQHRNGKRIPIDVGLGSLTVAGRPCSIAFVADVTPRYMHEKELEIHHRNLERVVDERTEELHLALRSTEANVNLLKEVVASFGHEFRTPLSIIVGYAEIMDAMNRDRIADSDKILRQYPQRILDAANKLIGLVEKASQMKVISTGKVAAETKPVDWGNIVEQVRRRNAAMMRET